MSAGEGGHVVALSGGIGGAKLALGLSRVLAPDDLTIIANTGDDFEHLGLAISPDIDTLTYTLAGLDNREQGWGRRDETWTFMQALRDICHDHGIVFIADEIQTGFGRTGRFFCSEYAGVEPDLMTTAKGMAGGFPLAGVTGKADIMDAPPTPVVVLSPR